MGTDKSLKAEAAGKRRMTTAAFYRILVNGALELGEVARLEVEIQKFYPHARPQPRCPDWHLSPPAEGESLAASQKQRFPAKSSHEISHSH